MDTLARTDWLTTEEIEGPLRRMAGNDARQIGAWASTRFKDGQGEALGVWRVAGTMITATGEQPFSMVLKGWARGDPDGSPAAAFWPMREADLYRSTVLEGLPGVAAPACHGAVEREGEIWVWLDDLTVFPQPAWTAERFASVGRRLGQMNGAYLAGRPLPDHPSLSRNWLEGWVAAGETVMEALDGHLAHPRVRAVLPPEVVTTFRRSWDRRQATFDALRSVPQVFAHLDAFTQNIFFRPGDSGEDLVLIDWSFAGYAAPGEELAALCAASATFDPTLLPIIEETEQAAFSGYIDGMREAGWRGDADEIWRAYRASMVLRYGPASVVKWLPFVTDDALFGAFEATYGVPGQVFVDHMATMTRWLAARADDA